MTELILVTVPWLVAMAFWIFVVWAVLATIGSLKEIRDDVRAIRASIESRP